MKKFLYISLLLTCLYCCAQSPDMAGAYEKKSGSFLYELQLLPSGVFYFESKNKGFKAGSPAEPEISGRGIWSAAQNIIYFETNPDKDLDYKYTLNFNDTKAKYIIASDKTTDKIEFYKSGIFWINGLELNKKNE